MSECLGLAIETILSYHCPASLGCWITGCKFVCGASMYTSGNSMHKQLKHFSLHHAEHCAEKIVSVHFGMGGVIHRVDKHTVTARLGCKSAMVGTGCANSCPGCMGTENPTLTLYRRFISI